MKTGAAILVVLMVGASTAQQPQAEFEVASVRRNLAGAPGSGGPTAVERFRPDGVSYTNYTAVMLIKAAYRILQDERLIGGPDWARTHRYDVIAKAPTEVSRDDVRMMMRRLLQDSFKL